MGRRSHLENPQGLLRGGAAFARTCPARLGSGRPATGAGGNKKMGINPMHQGASSLWLYFHVDARLHFAVPRCSIDRRVCRDEVRNTGRSGWAPGFHTAPCCPFPAVTGRQTRLLQSWRVDRVKALQACRVTVSTAPVLPPICRPCRLPPCDAGEQNPRLEPRRAGRRAQLSSQRSSKRQPL